MINLSKPVAMMLCAALFSTTVHAQEVKHSITQIKDGLYRFQNDYHHSVFTVSAAGIVVTNPINADAAQWLRSELARRFDQAVKYLIYSHDHVDHSSGGEVSGDGVTVIAHDNAKADIIGENRPTAVLDITFSDQFILELGGKTVEQMQQAISPGDHADWEGDAAQLPLNIEGMYNQINLHRRGN